MDGLLMIEEDLKIGSVLIFGLRKGNNKVK
jgi:hypothetical protein